MAGADRDGSPTQRAEALLSQWEKRVVDLARRTLARAVEEAEDIWAEVQSTRRGDEKTESRKRS
jgi:hypothetical protein